jgi:hypothetical protein
MGVHVDQARHAPFPFGVDDPRFCLGRGTGDVNDLRTLDDQTPLSIELPAGINDSDILDYDHSFSALFGVRGLALAFVLDPRKARAFKSGGKPPHSILS